MSSFLFVGCSSTDSRLSLVQNGVMNFCPQVTVKEMVNNYVQSPKWEAILATDGEDYVNIKGGITYDGMAADMLLQYKVDTNSDSFEVNAFEINGIPQYEYMTFALLEDMCNEAS